MDGKADSKWDVGAEEIRIEDRRKALRAAQWCKCYRKGCSVDGKARVGLALSGGGIRSATFSLGLLRSLSEARLIHSIDYLSTVSGGGYAGSFFCSLFVPGELRGRMPAPDDVPVQGAAKCLNHPAAAKAGALGCDPLGSPTGRKAISQLRQGGHYLAPNGTSDAVFAAVIGVRNWFAVAITTGLALLAFFLLMNVAILGLEMAMDLARPYVVRFGLSGRLGPWQLVLIALAFWPAACAWAYWFTRSGDVPRSRIMRLVSMQAIVAALVFVVAYVWPTSREGWHLVLRHSVLAISILSLLTYAAAELVSHLDERGEATREAQFRIDMLTEEDRVRDLLSRWLLTGAFVWMSAAVLAAIHWASLENIGETSKLAVSGVSWKDVALAAGVLSVAIPLARWLLARDDSARSGRSGRAIERRRLRQALSLLLGLVLLVAFLLFWATMASGAAKWVAAHTETAWANLDAQAPWLVTAAADLVLKPLGAAQESAIGALLLLTLMAVAVAIVAFLIGNVDSLLNRSSFSAFYSGRLRTAYLGATNAHRDPASGSGGTSVDRDDVFDEITLDGYYHPCVLAPIHLINVTINETTSKTSRVIQRDRKGKSMTVAPSGYLYPANAPGDDLSQIERSAAEDLPLSSWMAISGAAFTTGAGHHTSLGTSMLAGLTNLRLGYWWRHDCRHLSARLRKPSRTVQSYLLRELRASYDGTDDPERWYLSDGGHYENMGVYELVRRRVPFIIASDNGADRYYEFADLVNLIRKIRIDFNAEVEFLGDEELETLFGDDARVREAFATLEEIRRSGKAETAAAARGAEPKTGAYATLARIRYTAEPDVPTSTLLLIKPRIAGRELPDLIQYRDANAAFPQQPTTNQFFDEAQWESYYRLGQLIGDRIFAGRDSATQPPWKPWELRPLEDPRVRAAPATSTGA